MCVVVQHKSVSAIYMYSGCRQQYTCVGCYMTHMLYTPNIAMPNKARPCDVHGHRSTMCHVSAPRACCAALCATLHSTGRDSSMRPNQTPLAHYETRMVVQHAVLGCNWDPVGSVLLVPNCGRGGALGCLCLGARIISRLHHR